MKVTAEQIKASVAANGLTRVNIHDCSICGYECGYVFHGDAVFYDPGCDCTRNYSGHRPSDWEAPATHINAQSRTGKWGDIAAREALKFGIELEPVSP